MLGCSKYFINIWTHLWEDISAGVLLSFKLRCTSSSYLDRTRVTYCSMQAPRGFKCDSSEVTWPLLLKGDSNFKVLRAWYFSFIRSGLRRLVSFFALLRPFWFSLVCSCLANVSWVTTRMVQWMQISCLFFFFPQHDRFFNNFSIHEKY